MTEEPLPTEPTSDGAPVSEQNVHIAISEPSAADEKMTSSPTTTSGESDVTKPGEEETQQTQVAVDIKMEDAVPFSSSTPPPPPVPSLETEAAPLVPRHFGSGQEGIAAANALIADGLKLNGERGAPPEAVVKEEPEETSSFIPPNSDPKMREAEKRVLADKYDADSWKPLMSLAQGLPIADARKIYERFFAVFPMAGRYWKFYAEQEISTGNNDAAGRVFQRCLLICPVVDLWRSYLNHIQKLHDPEMNFERIYQCFEFAVKHLGQDISATTIWTDYLMFLKNGLENCMPFDKGVRTAALRSAYQRAVVVPMHGIDRLWQEYENFERQLDTVNNTGKEVLGPLISHFHAARNAYKERKRLREPVSTVILPRPVPVAQRDVRLHAAWRKLIDWELTNVQRLDADMFKQRLTLTYNQCILSLYYFPEMWYEAAMFQLDCKDADAAKTIFIRALESLPGCLLLRLAYAEFLELREETQAAELEYEKLLEEEENSLVFIQYMRFVRRIKGVEDARRVFIRGKRSQSCTFHVYVESARMELQANRQPKVARKIFELAWNLYSTDPAFVLAYVEFLQMLNEDTIDTEIRVLFEKALDPKNGMNADGQQLAWDKFLDFEISRGDLAAIHNIQKRRAAAFPELTSASRLMDLSRRFTFMDLLPGREDELAAPAFSAKSVLSETAKVVAAAFVPPPPPVTTSNSIPAPSTAPVPRFDVAAKIPLPPSIQNFVSQLPPHNLIIAEMREGKITRLPDIESVLGTLASLTIPEEFTKKVSEVGKRKYKDHHSHPGSHQQDEEDGKSAVAASFPVNDVYRVRQQQKQAKTQ